MTGRRRRRSLGQSGYTSGTERVRQGSLLLYQLWWSLRIQGWHLWSQSEQLFGSKRCDGRHPRARTYQLWTNGSLLQSNLWLYHSWWLQHLSWISKPFCNQPISKDPSIAEQQFDHAVQQLFSAPKASPIAIPQYSTQINSVSSFRQFHRWRPNCWLTIFTRTNALLFLLN